MIFECQKSTKKSEIKNKIYVNMEKRPTEINGS